MKRKISAPSLLAGFSWHRRYFNFKNNLYFNSHLFSTLNFFLLLTAFSVVLGFFRPLYWALSLSLSSYLIYAWFRTKKLAYGIQVRRIMDPKGREKEQFQIHYDISNSTGFSLPPFSFRQNFEGVQEGSFEVKVESGVPPQTRVRITSEINLDAGMGIKEIGDFFIKVHDELSLFPYKIEFQGKAEIEVYPLIIETPQLKKSISPDSTEFGFFDIQKRGESNLFIGTREYRHGDPIRQINWKLSRKTMKLIVNEFEKNTNTYVTLLLDLELSSQVGVGSLSTWEAAKDLALSIAANEIRQRNYIQVLAQDLFLPFGTGESQLLSVERHFTYHELSKTGLDHLDRLQDLPSQSQIYFFCPLLATHNVTETLNVLKRLRVLGHQITIFGFDPYYEMRKAATSEAHVPLLKAGEEARNQFSGIETDLRKVGIAFIKIDIRERVPLRIILKEKANHLLETRPN